MPTFFLIRNELTTYNFTSFSLSPFLGTSGVWGPLSLVFAFISLSLFPIITTVEERVARND